MPTPPLALIGCGAIADAFHIPALVKQGDLVKSLILVDRDIDRAESLRTRIGAAAAVADHREVVKDVAGAIVATPHHLHRPIVLDLVGAGAHVLSEKPLATTPAEVDEICAAAAAQGVHVAVNHTRRLFSSFQEVKRLVATGALGQLRTIDYVLGEPFAWPAATDAYFGTRAGGRGVLFDTGAHIVDLVCWWMGGEPEIIRYADDSCGGTEAVAELSLRRDDATATIRLSWLSKLLNRYRVVGTDGSVEGGVYDWSSYIRRNGRRKPKTIRTDKARSFTDFADRLLANFIDVIAGRATPLVSADDVRPSIAVIDNCYARRSRLPLPWHDAFKRLSNV